MKDAAIVGAFPFHSNGFVVLNVGCGTGRIDFHLASLGYRVFATDIEKHETWQVEMSNLTFYQSDIFDIQSFPILSAPVVICSEVLEHLKEYKTALKNLLELTEVRLIITIPFEKSFGGRRAGHCNFWGSNNIGEFVELCKPYSVTISKVRTKPEDIQMKQFCYLIVIDKR